MYIVTGDEIGFVKLLDINNVEDSKLSDNPAYKQPVAKNVSNRFKTQGNLESCTSDRPLLILNDSIKHHTRECQISCMSWNPIVLTKNIQKSFQNATLDR
jgi:hypothetical protein